MIVGVPKETYPGERRVALIPASVTALVKQGFEVVVEKNAGGDAGFPDTAYQEHGAEMVDRGAVFDRADIVLQVRSPGANASGADADVSLMKKGQVVIGLGDPLSAHEANKKLADAGVTYLAMELIPRITRAQSMDALSSMATVAGYKAVLMAANRLPRMFPMLMTAAGTVAPARVFVIGAGVAGLQAIATAKRLGGVVSGYDVRPVVREQVESLGGKFVELDLGTEDAEDAGGYAKALTEDQLVKQRAQLATFAADQDVIISTAAIPGRKSPLLITADAVKGMKPGSVVVDLAAERGGNCELTDGEETVAHGVTILGPLNLSTEIPFHASQMYAKNITTLLAHLVKDGELVVDLDDEITAGTLVTKDGEVLHARVRSFMGLEELKPEPAAPAEADSDEASAEDGDANEKKEE